MRLAVFIMMAALTACSPAVVEIPEPPEVPETGLAAPEPLSDIKQPSEIDFAAYNKTLAAFIGLDIGEPMNSAEQKVLTAFTADAGGEGNPVFEMDKFQGYIGGQAFVATLDNMADDSVKAQQLYAIGKKTSGEAYVLVDYGMRIKCRRGEIKNTWGTTLCP